MFEENIIFVIDIQVRLSHLIAYLFSIINYMLYKS